jgi:hypothetical protein
MSSPGFVRAIPYRSKISGCCSAFDAQNSGTSPQLSIFP